MNTLYTDALADLAGRTAPQIERIFICVQTTAPAQRIRLRDWLARCAARDAAAGSEEALTSALRDLVTLRNGQLTFTTRQPRPGGRKEAITIGDLGGAVTLGQVVIALLRCVAEHDPGLAMRLIQEVRRTDTRQRAEIARKIGWR